MAIFVSRNLLSRNIAPPALRPLCFEEFRRAQARRVDCELLDGSICERPAPPLAHETLRLWLQRLLCGWVEARNWGQIYDAETLVEIAERRARRPDIALVSKACRGIARNGALYGAPDIVIEIAYANDLRDELAARERDYRTLGVGEIVLIDPLRRTVRVVRRDDTIYTVETLCAGDLLCLHHLDGFAIPVSALFAEMRPPIAHLLDALATPA